MKILLTVDPEIPVPPNGYGGIERIVDLLVKQFVKKGFDVTLCAHPDSQVPCTLVKWKGAKSRGLSNIAKNTMQLTKLVYTNHFNIVHSFSRLAYMSAILPAPVPKIMSYQREPTLSQVKKAQRLAKKGSLVFTGCSNYIADKVATVAEAYTIYNCAPLATYTFTEKTEDNAPLVFLGRIEETKGTAIAIEVAIKAGKNLIIAGNIPVEHQAYFDKKIKPFLSDSIKYIGTVNDTQKNNLLGSALALIMPVCWNEPFGIVMAEAMACGSPVVGFRRGAIPEVITHGVNGFISENVNEMVEHVSLCHNLNRKEIRNIAEEKFSDEKISGDYLALYSKLISRRKN